MNLKQIRNIVKHKILEEQTLYDLRKIVTALKRLGQNYTRFLQVKQEVMN
jgi:hypothetical protein